MIKRNFPAEELRDILYGDSEIGTVIEDTIDDTSRWSICHTLVFKYEDKFYQSYYRVGATEYQDERPWDDEKEVECIEVEPVEVTVIQYKAKK